MRNHDEAKPALTLHGLYELLMREHGPTHWWPADTRFEIAIGAILVQDTGWRNARNAIDRLRDADALDAGAIRAMPDETLWELIRSAGYYRLKGAYLKAFCEWFDGLGTWTHDERIPGLVDGVADEALRRDLLSIRGVGGETADDILLYVFDRPTFVADRYARRMFETLGVAGLPKTYEGFRSRVMARLRLDEWTLDELKEFHGLIDELGKTCRNADDWNRSVVAGYRLLR